MSLIVGTLKLEQLDLSTILRGFETHAKTGLLIMKQEVQWVEFYFRDGQLICIGPLRTNATLGERLVQAGVISPQAAQEAMLRIGSEEPTEMRIALTLMDLGLVGREELRTWATQKALEVLQVVLTWSQGEIHFEAEALPPSDRLLVGLSITSLLDSIPMPKPAASVEQHIGADEYVPIFGLAPQTASSSSPIIAQAAPAPVSPPRGVDTSFMRPEMLLIPAKLSAQCKQSRYVTLTPEQWRLLTCVNGHTSLQRACQELCMTPETVCQIAGELVAEGLIHVAYSAFEPVNNPWPVAEELVGSGLSNGYGTSSTIPTATSSTQLRNTPVAWLKEFIQFSSTQETRSQWGNGGSGATFVTGRGWVTPKQPLLQGVR